MHKLLVVAGPTASGKSAVAIQLAKKLNGEILNLDSVQVYKGLDIGSAKLSLKEMSGIPHHLIDIIEPNQDFTVADYKKLADQVISEIISRNKKPILVGGSTLYLKVLLHGLVEAPSDSEELREKLESMTLEDLQAELKSKDYKTWQNIDLSNKRRLVRALEYTSDGKQSLYDLQQKHQFSNLDYSALIILLDLKRDLLYDKINQRSKLMLEKGLLKEVESLMSKYGNDLKCLQALGYKESIEYLKGNLDQKELEAEIAKNTRRYAKRQLTFWRNEPEKRGWNIKGRLECLDYDEISNNFIELQKTVNILRLSDDKLSVLQGNFAV